MARTSLAAGVAKSMCPVDAERKNIHSSVSCKFAVAFVKSVASLLVIPVGDRYPCAEIMWKWLTNSSWQVDKCHPVLWREKEKTIERWLQPCTRVKGSDCNIYWSSPSGANQLWQSPWCSACQCCWRHSPPQEIERPLAKAYLWTYSFHWDGKAVAKLFGKGSSRIQSIVKHQRLNFRVTAVDPRDQTVEAVESVDEKSIILSVYSGTQVLNREDGNLRVIWVFIKWIVTVRISIAVFIRPFKIFIFSKFTQTFNSDKSGQIQ